MRTNVKRKPGRLGAFSTTAPDGWAFSSALALVLSGLLSAMLPVTQCAAQGAERVKDRHMETSRERATKLPRSEGDQAVIDGWPLYRTPRGQTAFNDAMATLKATDGAAPSKDAFKGCADLECNIGLPAIGADGWIPAGRVWVSPSEYVLIVHSPRGRTGQSYRRRSARDMRVFVFHEFHNSSRNTDLYDTISSHSGSVFVPLYMSKPATDVAGRRFVIVVQVAPYDVVSIHATNHGSAGPGMEVARNLTDAVEPLQNTAGVVIATIAKAANPQLKVVNHHGAEGQPMLSAYERRLAAVKSRSSSPTVTLPFVPASPQRLASASGSIDDLILRRGASPRIPVAERAIVPPKAAMASAASAPARPTRAPEPAAPTPTAITASGLSPLAEYLRTNLAAMKRLPDYAQIIPDTVMAVAEESPTAGLVYLLDDRKQILGHIETAQSRSAPGRYAYVPLDGDDKHLFELDITKPLTVRSAALMRAPGDVQEPSLVGPIKPARRPAAVPIYGRGG